MNLGLLSVRRISYIIAWYISKIQNENHSKKFIYYYALQVVIGSLVKGFIIFLIALLLGILKEVITCFIVFCSIRIFSGGYHANTYTKCLLYSLTIIISIVFLSKLIFNFYSLSLNLLIFLIIFYITYKKAPHDHPNKPIISEKHRKSLKFKALVLNIFWLTVSVILLTVKPFPLYASIIALSALVEAITLTEWFSIKASKLENSCVGFCAKISINRKGG